MDIQEQKNDHAGIRRLYVILAAVLYILLVAAAAFFYFTVHRPLAYRVETMVVKPTDERRYIPLGDFTLTGYEKSEISCGKFANGKTAINLDVGQGLAAVDPRVIPVGSTIYVEQLGYFLAADVGGLIKRQRVDIFFQTHAEAMKFGRRVRKVWIVNVPRSVEDWKYWRRKYREEEREDRKRKSG